MRVRREPLICQFRLVATNVHYSGSAWRFWFGEFWYIAACVQHMTAKSNCWVFPNLLRLSGIVGMALGTTKIGLMISFISSAIVQLGGIPVLFAMRTHPQHGSVVAWSDLKISMSLFHAFVMRSFARGLTFVALRLSAEGSSGADHCCETIWPSKGDFVQYRWGQGQSFFHESEKRWNWSYLHLKLESISTFHKISCFFSRFFWTMESGDSIDLLWGFSVQ